MSDASNNKPGKLIELEWKDIPPGLVEVPALDLVKVFKGFYSPLKAISYLVPYIFSIGTRSIGKSTGWAIYLLFVFFKYGRQFIYVRRTDDELSKTAATWFDNAFEILKRWGLKTDGRIVQKGDRFILRIEQEEEETYYDKHGNERTKTVTTKIEITMGYCIALSMVNKYKSMNLSRVWWIVYDEFLPQFQNGFLGGAENYKKEVTLMSSLYTTVDRDIGRPYRNETRVVFLGNLSDYSNPFFMAYGVDEFYSNNPEAKYIHPKGRPWVLENTSSVEAVKGFENSWGYMIATEKDKDYAYRNRSYNLTDSDFICKLKDSRQGLFNLTIDGIKLGIFFVPDLHFIYVDSTKFSSTGFDLVASASDHNTNTEMITRYSQHDYTKLLYNNYMLSRIRYNNRKSKMLIEKFIGISYNL